MRAVKRRCIRCQQDEGIAAPTERGQCGATREDRKEEKERVPSDWLSVTCRHADMSAVTLKMSSWNDHGPVYAGRPLTDYCNAIIDVQMRL